MSEETLFHEALAKPPAERAAFLDAACTGQPELRQAIEALLAAHTASASLLNQPAVDPNRTGAYTPSPVEATGVHVPKDAQPGYVIAGRYTLEQRIGEGGMGEVWVAKQTAPVKRKVALKLIKAGMDSKAVLQRFEAERQALALMDHPNIAKVLDGGVVGQASSLPLLAGQAGSLPHGGHPFFVMELVNGLPLNKFCDEARLTPKERLELFVPICQAVQHAHQKGIVHRDLKPANILVTLIDGQPVPKVIDFGVAKATAGKLTDESLSTQFGAVVGTLEYMAPEQAGYSGEDIDTRADIYSLGVILYEMLTGLRPLDAKRLKKAALSEMIRIIREEEPSKPSTRLSTEESLPSLAALRQTEPKRLMALLRGELDWVVMKCLEKQRDRRYETANALGRDIQRYLADEPVEARLPSASYRFKKFVTRHKGQVIAASLVLFALVAGLAGTAWGLSEAMKSAEAERAAKQDAQEKQKEAETAARAEKKARLKEVEERQYAQAIAAFVRDDFLALTSLEGQYRFAGAARVAPDRHLTLRQMLDRAAQKLDQRTDLAPRTQADLRWMIGENYRGQGEYVRAIRYLERSLALRRETLGLDHPDTVVSMNSLAFAYQEAGKMDQALPLFEATFQYVKAGLGPEAPKTLECMTVLAACYREAGKPAQAVPLMEETLKLSKAVLGPDHPDTVYRMGSLAETYRKAGKPHLAIPLNEETFQRMKATLGADHPFTLTCMANLASAYRDAGKLNLALPLDEEAFQRMKPTLGADHPHTLTCMVNLAIGYQTAGKLNLAVPLLEEALKLLRVKLGADHPHTVGAMIQLSIAYKQTGKPAMALPLLEELFKMIKNTSGPDHPDTLAIMNNLAQVYWSLGKLDQSIPLFEENVRRKTTKFGRSHPSTLGTIGNLGVNYLDAGRLAEAIPLLEETYRASRQHPSLRGYESELKQAYTKAGDTAKLAKLLQEQLAEARKALPKDSPQLAGLLAQIGSDFLAQKLWIDAEPLFRECLALRAKLQPDAWQTFYTQTLLGGALLGQQKYAEAEPLLLKGYEGMKQREKTIPPQGKVRLIEALERLVQLYEVTGKKDDAAKWRKELEATKAVQKQTEKQP